MALYTSYGSTSPWKSATVFLQLFVMAAIKGYSSCWHFWGSEPSALKPAKCTEETCLPCASFKHSPGHASLFAWFTAVWGSVPNLHQSSSWWTTLFCLLPLLFEELCAPGNTHRNCDPGEFFHWLPWGLKEACKGRLTLPFPYSAAERFATISFYLITSLSFQLVTAYDASSWSNYLRHNKTYLI